MKLGSRSYVCSFAVMMSCLFGQSAFAALPNPADNAPLPSGCMVTMRQARAETWICPRNETGASKTPSGLTANIMCISPNPALSQYICNVLKVDPGLVVSCQGANFDVPVSIRSGSTSSAYSRAIQSAQKAGATKCSADRSKRLKSVYLGGQYSDVRLGYSRNGRSGFEYEVTGKATMCCQNTPTRTVR